ncbi:type IV pilin protein [Gammaproteobacteria bacterium]|nr:type IV pilin protein [Gammaproteobacteria bacterium]
MTQRKIAQAGITLIELMIVLAVLSILAAIALPSYEQVMERSRRTEAREALSDFASRQEQFFLDNTTYSSTISVLGRNAVTENGNYTISIPAATAVSYTLRATAQASQADDTTCATMNLTSTGSRTPDDCW